MNVIKYEHPSHSKKIVYCIVDRVNISFDDYTKEIIKNLSDFLIGQIYRHNYNVIVSLNEDALLKYAAQNGYEHAMVFSTGNEIENGKSLFQNVETLVNTEYFIYGHILDRSEAYYELHHQSYLINLKKYALLDYPEVGEQKIGESFKTIKPERSLENIHDGYTPFYINPGKEIVTYSHRMHGYNIISEGLDIGFSIKAFSEEFRKNKRYYYPEDRNVFYRNLSYAYSKQNYCLTKFIHSSPTDSSRPKRKYDQIITVATGDWMFDYLKENGNVIIYDYNLTALNSHKNKLSKYSNVEFVEYDVLGYSGIECLLKYPDRDTIINVTNVFAYEGTSTFIPYRYRVERESSLINSLPKHWDVLIGDRVYEPFGDNYDIRTFRAPSWHMNGDWC